MAAAQLSYIAFARRGQIQRRQIFQRVCGGAERRHQRIWVTDLSLDGAVLSKISWQACRSRSRFLHGDKSDKFSVLELSVLTVHLVGVAACDFRFRARGPMCMARAIWARPGAATSWRALKRAVCITGLPACRGCRFETSSPHLFETSPGGEDVRFAGIEPFWPFLALARWVHVGKGPAMGVGATRVAAA